MEKQIMTVETIEQRIKKYFEEQSEWHHIFKWSDGKYYGAKYETVKSFAKIFGCPYTSLYLPVKRLAASGFLTYSEKLIYYEREVPKPKNVLKH